MRRQIRIGQKGDEDNVHVHQDQWIYLLADDKVVTVTAGVNVVVVVASIGCSGQLLSTSCCGMMYRGCQSRSCRGGSQSWRYGDGGHQGWVPRPHHLWWRYFFKDVRGHTRYYRYIIPGHPAISRVHRVYVRPGPIVHSRNRPPLYAGFLLSHRPERLILLGVFGMSQS